MSKNKTMMRKSIMQKVQKNLDKEMSDMPTKTLEMYHHWNELSDDSEDFDHLEKPTVFDLESKCRKCDKPRALCNIHRR
jgi:hypothetical protein